MLKLHDPLVQTFREAIVKDECHNGRHGPTKCEVAVFTIPRGQSPPAFFAILQKYGNRKTNRPNQPEAEVFGDDERYGNGWAMAMITKRENYET